MKGVARSNPDDGFRDLCWRRMEMAGQDGAVRLGLDDGDQLGVDGLVQGTYRWDCYQLVRWSG